MKRWRHTVQRHISPGELQRLYLKLASTETVSKEIARSETLVRTHTRCAENTFPFPPYTTVFFCIFGRSCTLVTVSYHLQWTGTYWSLSALKLSVSCPDKNTLITWVQLVEYRTRNQKVAGSTHTRSTASNLDQVANLLCAQTNSASYPQRDGTWVVATATG